MPSCSAALVLKLVIQNAKLPNCKDTMLAAGMPLHAWKFEGDHAISHNGSFEWSPFDSHKFWSRRRL